MSILNLIAKLQSSADSFEKNGNTAAALSYAAKVQELLTKHKLSMSEVDTETLNQQDPIGQEIIDPPHIRAGQKAHYWVSTLASVVAIAHYCKAITHIRSTKISFVGRKSDREVAVHIFEYLLYICQLECLREEKKALTKKGFRASFRRAFALTVHKRYQAQMKAPASNETERNALVVSSEKSVVAWIQSNLKTKNNKSSGINNLNFEGLKAGERSGETVKLNRRGIKRGPVSSQIR